MLRSIHIALLALLVIATGAITLISFDLHKFLVNANQGVTEGRTVLARVNGPTGTITEADKLLLALKSTTVHADLVIAHEDAQLPKYDRMLSSVVSDVHGITGQLGEAATTVSGTANKASDALRTVNQTIAAAQPLLAHLDSTAQASTLTIDSLNARVRDPRIDALVDHLNSISASADGITADGRKSADYLTQKLIAPRTFWQGVRDRADNIFDITAFLARHY